MDIKTLRYALTTCRLMHVGKAAEELGIAQPTLSHKISTLENELGVKLFIRKNRSISLSPAGEIFMEESRKIVAAADQMVNLVRSVEQGLSGTLHVGYSGSVLLTPGFSEAIKQYGRSFPAIHLCLHENTPIQTLQSMEARKFDLAFTRGPIPAPPPSLVCQIFCSAPLAVAMHKDHPRARANSIRFRDLKDENFVSFNDPEGLGLHASLKFLCNEASFEPKITVRADSVASCINLVVAGMGITILPSDFCMRELHTELVLLPITDINAETEIVQVRRKIVLSPVERHFLAWIKADHEKRQQMTVPGKIRAQGNC